MAYHKKIMGISADLKQFRTPAQDQSTVGAAVPGKMLGSGLGSGFMKKSVLGSVLGSGPV